MDYDLLSYCYTIFLQAHATFKLSVLEVLSELSRTCDLYLMETVEDDESEVWVILLIYHRKNSITFYSIYYLM